MQKITGKVIKVFIPENEENIYNSNKLGFQIKTSNGIEEIIVEQNDKNINILKNDIVLVTKTIINNDNFIYIEPIEVKSDE